jgi:hypothetical protein
MKIAVALLLLLSACTPEMAERMRAARDAQQTQDPYVRHLQMQDFLALRAQTAPQPIPFYAMPPIALGSSTTRLQTICSRQGPYTYCN